MKLSLGFSPCPNDTFIFDAMIHQKVDTEGLTFDVSYQDVETLNQRAFNADLDITKLSYHAYAYLTENYVLLHSGSALGFGVGPLLICNDPSILREGIESLTSRIGNLKVGIPGKNTTANFLLSLAFPEAENKVEMKFSEIEPALLNNRIDLGVIIHENRFTYEDKGLLKVMDLGEYWEKLTSCPIPLGGIMIKRSLPEEVKQKVNRIIQRSVMFAIKNPLSGLDFIRSHAQEMSTDVMYKHIELYVNKYSVDLGDEGRRAVNIFFDEALKKGIIPDIKQNLFL
ncbi:menaquinone biosynthesis family protein [Daejeonella lutea]|uniref:1,4-dihydroxy-6-naphtoate synthase n=1 Tax=Daejeonella lutea TaxID=572036 RepID=A0A1T5DVU3_9SPHI|nr:1,4-dihydroxy-6-naphthoate synthase [Daejeonella lutea]SKB75764.1 1,4-dihydroxy-6-naphthoate synthase [Daejeonella lutea]